MTRLVGVVRRRSWPKVRRLWVSRQWALSLVAFREGHRALQGPIKSFFSHADCEVVPPLDAHERGEREVRADGSIGHAEVQIDDSVLTLSEATDDSPARPCVNFAYVEAVDRVYERAIAAGATHLHQPKNWPCGDRVAGLHDPFDNRWWIATKLPDGPPA